MTWENFWDRIYCFNWGHIWYRPEKVMPEEFCLRCGKRLKTFDSLYETYSQLIEEERKR